VRYSNEKFSAFGGTDDIEQSQKLMVEKLTNLESVTDDIQQQNRDSYARFDDTFDQLIKSQQSMVNHQTKTIKKLQEA